VLRAWLDGAFELVVSSQLLSELERALTYPKLRGRVEPSEGGELVELLRRGDGHLLGLAGRLPVFSPAEFLAELERRP